jgi:hypothetical protein
MTSKKGSKPALAPRTNDGDTATAATRRKRDEENREGAGTLAPAPVQSAKLSDSAWLHTIVELLARSCERLETIKADALRAEDVRSLEEAAGRIRKAVARLKAFAQA